VTVLVLHVTGPARAVFAEGVPTSSAYGPSGIDTKGIGGRARTRQSTKGTSHSSSGVGSPWNTV
jgi:hypothetical protein